MPFPPATLEQILEERERVGGLDWAAASQNGFIHQNTISHDVYEAFLAGGSVINRSAAEGLRTLGYLTAEGSWAETGSAARTMFERKRAVRVVQSHRGQQSTLLAAFDEDYAVVVSGPPVGAAGVLGSGEFGISYFPVEALVGAVLRWLAISPAWAFVGTDFVFSEQQLETLLRGETTTLPEEARPQLGLMAGQDWSRFSIALGELEPTQFVAVDGWGYFAIEPVDGGLRLAAMHTSVIYRLLIEGVYEQLAS